MATLNSIVYDLANTARGGVTSDDDSISLRQIKFWVQNTRAKLIKQDLDKRRSINPDLIQSLGCVAVSEVDGSECNCVVLGCKILRTTLPIPRPIELQQRNLLTRVGPILTTDKPFSLISYHRVPFIGNDRFTKKLTRAFQHNGYIYLINPNDKPLLTKINVQGVFEDPTEAAAFSHCSGDACYTDDSQYPIASWMIEDLKAMVLNTDFRIAVSAATDTKGDAKSNEETSQIAGDSV